MGTFAQRKSRALLCGIGLLAVSGRTFRWNTRDAPAAISPESGAHDDAAKVEIAWRHAKRGLNVPIGRLVDYAYAGVDPRYMGIGPVPAVQKLLKK